ncbi:hypothetical protein H0H92_013668 [Tricholoma furcatifolium]|nr:hypothetical protein H0H92_013668 [Tricholoma furcatifolium]
MSLELFSLVRNKVSKYRWLYQDIPEDQQLEELALNIKTLPDTLEIKMDWPSGCLTCPITDNLKLNVALPLSRRLASRATLMAALKGFSLIGKANLHIFLPEVDLSYDDKQDPSPPIPLDLFKDIRQLRWMGYRDQLCKFWIPMSPLVFPSLTSLKVASRISIQDCAHILFHFDRLTTLTVEYIDKELSKEPRLPFSPRSTHVERPELESLTLWSNDDIGPLLLQFTFPSLQHVEFDLRYPTIGTFDGLDIWTNVEDAGGLHCWTTIEDGAWIRNALPPQSSFFTRRPGNMGPLRRNDDDSDEEGPYEIDF